MKITEQRTACVNLRLRRNGITEMNIKRVLVTVVGGAPVETSLMSAFSLDSFVIGDVTFAQILLDNS